jgi:hypothetical protein
VRDGISRRARNVRATAEDFRGLSSGAQVLVRFEMPAAEPAGADG